MSLPGKLCIGILEEDNPLKSYFRFKPLIVEQEGRYVPYDGFDAYPKDGCIRIVPDKNESSHFKARMRRMGLFAVVNLIEHPNENDKIRANKNYTSDDTENNAYIIYSDVVREPAVGILYTLLRVTPAEAPSAVLPDGCTPLVLLRPENEVLEGVWSCQADAEQSGKGCLSRSETSVNPADLQIFDLPGFRGETLSFAVLLPDKVESVVEPIPVKPTKQSSREVRKEEPVSASAEPPVTPEEKPWIHHEESAAPEPVDQRLSPFQQSLAAQSGLNPRRNRTLKEIIDDKWRHSRIDQLGLAVPEVANSTPVQNPVEQAAVLVRSLWERADLRGSLLKSFAEIEGLDRALDVQRRTARENRVAEQLNELEAQRLEILADLDALKRRKGELREEFKREIRREEESAFADAVKKTEQARAEQERQEAAAARAKTAAETAEDALNALGDGRFEKRLNEFAIHSRAVELIRNLGKPMAAAPGPDGGDADAETLIARVTECFADAGRPIARDDAIHLLICAAQGDFLLLSGPVGCGKSETVRLLARALGAKTRYVEFAPGKGSLAEQGKLPGASGDAVAMVLLDDANLVEIADLTRGLTPAAERGQFLCCVTLQDDGHPVSSHLFDRAFTVRLSEEAADTPWRPVERGVSKEYEPVSRRALRAAFAPQSDAVPETLTRRMEALRGDLELLGVCISRRTLTALWNYCSTAIQRMSEEPAAVLDRALAARAIPAMLAGAPLAALAALPRLLEDLPRCRALFSQPLPIQV